MIQFISKNIKLDLTTSNLTFIQENHWFKDTLFQEYSLPVSIYLTDEMKKMFGFLDDFNSVDNDTVFEGKLYRDGEIEDATLEIMSISVSLMKINIKLKGNKLVNWEQKLASLDLESFELQGEDIYQHATSVIDKVYPDVNYNFPSVWTDRFDTSTATFSEFKKQLNAWDLANNDWFKNEIDTQNNIIYNRNIMQPFPYLLHILKQGFADAGYTLAGDVISDDDISKALIVASVDYFSTSDQQEISIKKGYQDYDSFYYRQCQRNNSIQVLMAEYSEAKDITNVGRYRIIGDVWVVGSDCSPETIEIKYGNDTLYIYEKNEQEWPNNVKIHIDVTFEASSIDVSAGKQVTLFVLDKLNNNTVSTKIDININPIRYHNDSGDAADVIYLPNEINLKRTVPDMTFGEFVKAVMNWKNLDFQINGNVITMNYISTAIDRSNAVDLSEFCPLHPQQTMNKTKSFELKFIDSDVNPDYPYKKIYIDNSGYIIDNYEKEKTTKQILINLLPLPTKTDGNITTATMVDDDETKLRLVFYKGLSNGLPYTELSLDAIFPNLYFQHWKDWLEFRINTRTFKWRFFVNPEFAREIQINRLIFGFRNFLIPKKINKSRIGIAAYEIEIEADKLV